MGEESTSPARILGAFTGCLQLHEGMPGTQYMRPVITVLLHLCARNVPLSLRMHAVPRFES